jgi:hypothetical protein
VIVLLCLLLGLVLRLATGRSLGGLGRAKLRGETLLLVLLVAQAALPLIPIDGVAARVAFYAWAATFPCMIAIAWFNGRQPGMPMLGLGLLLNLAVISANGGMPVFGAAIQAVKQSVQPLVIPAGDFIHVVGGQGTWLPWLADVIPLPAPSWLRAVASPGDVLLFAGVVAFVGMAGVRESASSKLVKKQESAY